MAVQVPGAGAAVDDGLEGAEPALGWGAAPGQIDRERLCLLAGQRGGRSGKEVAGVDGAGAGDPDVLQDVFQVGLGEVDVVLGHPLGDVTEIAADVGQARASAQQVGCQAVPGLVRNPAADVELVDPQLEALVEPVVGQRRPSVTVALVGREQCHLGPLLRGGRPVVPSLEQLERLVLAGLQELVDSFGDAQGLVVVADLGLVVPEHREAAVAAETVQAQREDLAAAAAGDDDRFPSVAQTVVERVVMVRELAEVVFVGERAGDAVGERGPRAADRRSWGGHGGDEVPVQAEAFGFSRFQSPA